MTWIKLFSDSDCEVGSDENIEEGTVSWTRGRQDIREVILSDDLKKYSASLVADICSSWWQFDRFEAAVQEGLCVPVRTNIVVQAQISKEMVGYNVYLSTYKVGIDKSCSFFIVDKSDNNLGYNKNVILAISNNQIGKWITVVLPRGAPPRLFVTDKGKLK